MKKLVKCINQYVHNNIAYYEVGKIYLVKPTTYSKNAHIVGGTCILTTKELYECFEEVLENDSNKILCIRDYFHNTHRHYTKDFDYYLYEIDWEREVVSLSSNFHPKTYTKLNIIKSHFDITKILRRKKINKLLNSEY